MSHTFTREFRGRTWTVTVDEDEGTMHVDVNVPDDPDASIRVAEGSLVGPDGVPTLNIGPHVGLELRQGLPQLFVDETAIELMGATTRRLVERYVAPAAGAHVKRLASGLFPPTRRQRERPEDAE